MPPHVAVSACAGASGGAAAPVGASSGAAGRRFPSLPMMAQEGSGVLALRCRAFESKSRIV